MGHQVEYVIDLPPAPVREWLSSLSGWWAELESPGEIPWGEFEWGGQALHADLGPAACQVRVPCIKYSWLIGDHEASLAWVARFEAWLPEALAGVRAVRVDELLRLDWESQSGRELWQWPDPVRSLREWLLASGQDAHVRAFLKSSERTLLAKNNAVGRRRPSPPPQENPNVQGEGPRPARDPTVIPPQEARGPRLPPLGVPPEPAPRQLILPDLSDRAGEDSPGEESAK